MRSFDQSKPKSQALKRRQARVLAALIISPTVEECARVTGIGASTIRRWLTEDKDFQQALSTAQARFLDEVFNSLAVQASHAVSSLMRNLSCGTHGVETRAALGFLALLMKREQSAKYARMESEIERLAALVEAQDARKGVEI